MRILLVGDGRSRHIERLAQSLTDSGVGVVIASFEPPDVPGVEAISLGSLPAQSDRRYLLAIPRLIRAVETVRPHVVHAHYLSSYGVMAAAALWFVKGGRRPPLIQSVWGSDILVTAKRSRVRDVLARFALRTATAVTGDSDELESEVRQRAPSVRWHTFIFGPPQALLRAPIRMRRPSIVSHRRLVSTMRISLILEAFALAKKAYPSLEMHQLLVVGDGPLKRQLQTNHTDEVRFVGNLETTALHALLLESQAFISVPVTDGTSASLLEGMAAGSTPIVNDLPANRQWVTPDVGVVVSRDPTAGELGAAIAQAVEGRWAGTAARAAVAGAVWEQQVDGLVRLYETLRRPAD